MKNIFSSKRETTKDSEKLKLIKQSYRKGGTA